MNPGKPWKLYGALSGKPRSLIAEYETLSEAAWAYRDVTGSKNELLRFSVTIRLGPPAGEPKARFEGEAGRASYLIDLEE
jgi:hypothetical protein